MQASEKLFLHTIGRYMSGRFKTWAAPLLERLEKIERLFAQQPDDIQRMVESAVANYLTARADFARADVAEMIAAAVTKIPAGPPGKDGADGCNGADGKDIAAADVQRMVDVAVARCIAGLPDKPRVVAGFVDLVGDLHFTLSDGSNFKVGHVVGKDADPADIDAKIKAASEKYPPPKDGRDGFSLESLAVEFDGERTATLIFADKETRKEFKLVFPVLVYRDVWHEGAYQRGDVVTLEGSAWVALADTDTRPGTPDCHWRLAVKRGRDGKEGKKGDQGAAGKGGRDGRDLTQIGFDGRKY